MTGELVFQSKTSVMCRGKNDGSIFELTYICRVLWSITDIEYISFSVYTSVRRVVSLFFTEERAEVHGLCIVSLWSGEGLSYFQSHVLHHCVSRPLQFILS